MAFSIVSTVLSLYVYGMIMRVYVQFHRRDEGDGDEGSDSESESESESDDNDVPEWLRKTLKK